MADYLLDTAVIIDYLRGENKKVEFIKRLASEGSPWGVVWSISLRFMPGCERGKERHPKKF
jgi:hypothetical protein